MSVCWIDGDVDPETGVDFMVGWEGCDVVVETTVVWYTDFMADESNTKMVEVVVQDKLCEVIAEGTDFEYFSKLHFKFTASLEPV